MYFKVLSMLEQAKERTPIFLMIIYVLIKVSRGLLVTCSHFQIVVRVRRRGRQQAGAKTKSYWTKIITEKLQSIVVWKTLRQHVKHSQLMHRDSDNSRNRSRFWRERSSQFRVVVRYNTDQADYRWGFSRKTQKLHFNEVRGATGGEASEAALVFIDLTIL